MAYGNASTRLDRDALAKTVDTLEMKARPTVTSALAWVALAWSAHCERRALARLDQRALKDLGIPVSDAMQEAARPVWDLPRGR